MVMFRKLFNLTKEDDVCQYVIKRPLPLKVRLNKLFTLSQPSPLVHVDLLKLKFTFFNSFFQ